MKKMLRPQLMLVFSLVFFSTQAYAQETKCRLNIGASLHPYYSWVKNIVGDEANVTSIIPPGSDLMPTSRTLGYGEVAKSGCGHR